MFLCLIRYVCQSRMEATPNNHGFWFHFTAATFNYILCICIHSTATDVAFCVYCNSIRMYSVCNAIANELHFTTAIHFVSRLMDCVPSWRFKRNPLLWRIFVGRHPDSNRSTMIYQIIRQLFSLKRSHFWFTVFNEIWKHCKAAHTAMPYTRLHCLVNHTVVLHSMQWLLTIHIW